MGSVDVNDSSMDFSLSSKKKKKKKVIDVDEEKLGLQLHHVKSILLASINCYTFRWIFLVCNVGKVKLDRNEMSILKCMCDLDLKDRKWGVRLAKNDFGSVFVSVLQKTAVFSSVFTGAMLC